MYYISLTKKTQFYTDDNFIVLLKNYAGPLILSSSQSYDYHYQAVL